jgi:hypothetical protein
MTPIQKSESLEHREEKRVCGEDALALWARAWSALKRIWFDGDQLCGKRQDRTDSCLSMTRARIWRWPDRTHGSNEAENTSNLDR